MKKKCIVGNEAETKHLLGRGLWDYCTVHYENSGPSMDTKRTPFYQSGYFGSYYIDAWN